MWAIKSVCYKIHFFDLLSYKYFWAMIWKGISINYYDFESLNKLLIDRNYVYLNNRYTYHLFWPFNWFLRTSYDNIMFCCRQMSIEIFMTIGTTQISILLLFHQIKKIKSVCYKTHFLGHNLFMMKVDLLSYTRKFIDWTNEKHCHRYCLVFKWLSKWIF